MLYLAILRVLDAGDQELELGLGVIRRRHFGEGLEDSIGRERKIYQI